MSDSDRTVPENSAHPPADGMLNAALRFIDNPLPMWVYDLETLQIVDANDAALALYGYRRDELVGRPVTILRPSRSGDDFEVHVTSSDDPLPFSIRQRRRRKDGSLVDVHVQAHPLTYARRSAVLSVAQAVTDPPGAARGPRGFRTRSSNASRSPAGNCRPPAGRTGLSGDGDPRWWWHRPRRATGP